MELALYWMHWVLDWFQNIFFALALVALYLVALIPSAFYVFVSEHANIKKVGWDTFFLWLLVSPLQVLLNFFMWSDPPPKRT